MGARTYPWMKLTVFRLMSIPLIVFLQAYFEREREIDIDRERTIVREREKEMYK